MKSVAPPLLMSAKRALWRMHDHAGEADTEFRQVRDTVLSNADRRCVYCGLRAPKYQEVHHGDDDHANNAPSNLFCVCPLCHQVFHLGLAGLEDGGDLIVAAEFSQAELNALTVAIWLAVASGSEYAGTARMVYEDLQKRSFYVTSIFREWARQDNVELQEPFRFSPDMLANGLMSLTDEEYANRAALLGDLRLLPREARFAPQIKHWVTHFGRSLPPAQWEKIIPNLKEVFASLQKAA